MKSSVAALIGFLCLCLHAVRRVHSFTPQTTFGQTSFTTRSKISTSERITKLASAISAADIDILSANGYCVIPNFISEDLVSDLANDVQKLRNNSKFNVARIGQDSTNALNEDIRVAETCFLGPTKLKDIPSASRDKLYEALDGARSSLSTNSKLDVKDAGTGEMVQCAPALMPMLTEMLYAYYPKGGFYRRHRDAIPKSASVLRCFSLLLYLNENWKKEDGGELRMHFDSGGDFLPDGEAPNFIDVEPRAGTLVLFRSDKVPHEVLNTNAERLAVVGWYNRAVSAGDVDALATDEDKTRLLLLAVSAVLVLGGTVSLIMGM